MIYKEDCTLPREYLERLTGQGLEGLPELVRVLIIEAMRIERENYLQAKPYERNEERQGHANGYKPKTVKTRVGEVTFDVPQVREGGFYPQSLEKGIRSERALLLTLAEMYIQGVSTRKAVFMGISWQRCQFHLQQNAQAYVPSVGMRREVAEYIRTIFNAPDRETAEEYLKKRLENMYLLPLNWQIGWESTSPKVSPFSPSPKSIKDV